MPCVALRVFEHLQIERIPYLTQEKENKHGASGQDQAWFAKKRRMGEKVLMLATAIMRNENGMYKYISRKSNTTEKVSPLISEEGEEMKDD